LGIKKWRLLIPKIANTLRHTGGNKGGGKRVTASLRKAKAVMREKRAEKLAKREYTKLKRVAVERLKRRLTNSCGDDASLADEVLALSNMTVEISRSGIAGEDKTREAQLGAATDLLQRKVRALNAESKMVTMTQGGACADCVVKVSLAGVDAARIFDDLASICAIAASGWSDNIEGFVNMMEALAVGGVRLNQWPAFSLCATRLLKKLQHGGGSAGARNRKRKREDSVYYQPSPAEVLSEVRDGTFSLHSDSPLLWLWRYSAQQGGKKTGNKHCHDPAAPSHDALPSARGVSSSVSSSTSSSPAPSTTALANVNTPPPNGTNSSTIPRCPLLSMSVVDSASPYLDSRGLQRRRPRTWEEWRNPRRMRIQGLATHGMWKRRQVHAHQVISTATPTATRQHWRQCCAL
jgi:hypothetical protein